MSVGRSASARRLVVGIAVVGIVSSLAELVTYAIVSSVFPGMQFPLWRVIGELLAATVVALVLVTRVSGSRVLGIVYFLVVGLFRVLYGFLLFRLVSNTGPGPVGAAPALVIGVWVLAGLAALTLTVVLLTDPRARVYLDEA